MLFRFKQPARPSGRPFGQIVGASNSLACGMLLFLGFVATDTKLVAQQQTGVCQPTVVTDVSSKSPVSGLVSMGLISFNSSTGTSFPLPDNSLEDILYYNSTSGATHTYNDPSSGALLNDYSAVVINVLWSQLEPSRGSFCFAAIDGPLKTLAAYNAGTYQVTTGSGTVTLPAPSVPVRAKIRVWAGRNAPSWVLGGTVGSTCSPTLPDTSGAVGGVCISSTSSNPGVNPILIPRYWTPQYKTDYRELQSALATQYDQDSRVGGISATSCMSITDEPFNTPNDSYSQTNMRAESSTGAGDGYVDGNDTLSDTNTYSGSYCLAHAASDVGNYWSITPIDFTFSPFHVMNSHGVMPVDDSSGEGLAEYAMDAFGTAYGAQGVIGNHALQYPTLSTLSEIYTELDNDGRNSACSGDASRCGINSSPSMGLQTASQSVITKNVTANGSTSNWDCVIAHGADEGARQIELWMTIDGTGKSNAANISPTQLSNWAQTAWSSTSTRTHSYCTSVSTSNTP